MHSHFDLRQIILSTCERWPDLPPSDQLVVQSLVALGHAVTPLPWQMGIAPLAQHQHLHELKLVSTTKNLLKPG